MSVKGFPAVHAHTIDPESENKGHQTQIVVIDTPKIRNPDFITGHVKVSCSCEFFMYNSEYALHKWGAANIRYSNGEPATFTNSDNFPILCKHLYALGYKVYINARKKT